MKLKEKVALITGAGSGMGRASAILFGKEFYENWQDLLRDMVRRGLRLPNFLNLTRFDKLSERRVLV
jgi:hypothetical protein